MDANRLLLIKAHSVDHNYDVKALVAEVERLQAEVEALSQPHTVSDARIDAVMNDVEDEIYDLAGEYVFGTYGDVAHSSHRAYVQGAFKGLEIAARIVENGR